MQHKPFAAIVPYKYVKSSGNIGFSDSSLGTLKGKLAASWLIVIAIAEKGKKTEKRYLL